LKHKPSYRLINDQNHSSFIIKEEAFDLHTQWHYHPEVEIMYFDRGKVSGIMGNRFFNFKEGDMVLLGSNFPHVIFEHRRKRKKSVIPSGVVIQFRYDFLGERFFEALELKAVKQLLIKAKNGIFFEGKAVEAVRPLICGISKRKSSRQLLDLIEVLTMLSENDAHQLLSIDNQYNQSELDEYRMHLVKEYIYNNFKKKIRISELASLVSMTETSFCRYYKSRTLKSLTQTLNEIRVSYACELLKSRDHNITDACYESGFSNPAYFSRAFKKIVGISPTQYKQQTDPKILRW